MAQGLCGNTGNTHGRRWKGSASALPPGPAGKVESPKRGSPASHLFDSQLFRMEKICKIMDSDVPPALPRPPSQKLMERKAQLLRQEQEEIQELCRT